MNGIVRRTLVFGYVFSSLALSGIPGWSSLSFAFFAALWVVLGAALFSGRLTVGIWVLFPLMFVLHCGLVSVLVAESALDALMTTLVAWGGATAVAISVSNGVSLRLVLTAMVMASAANAAAVLVGFDAYLLYGAMSGETEEALLLRPSGLVGNPNLLAVQAILPLFALALWKKHATKVLWVIAISCGLFAFVTSGSRKSLVLLVALVLFTLVVQRRKTLGYLACAVGVLTSFAAAVWVAVESEMNEPDGYSVLALSRMLFLFEGGDTSIEERTNFWNHGWSAFADSPIWGYGLDSFRHVSGTGSYAHINQIELLVAGGVLLAGTYYLIHVAAALRAYSALRAAPTLRDGYCLLLAVFVVLDFTMVSYNAKVISLFLSLLLAVPDKKVMDKRTERRPFWPMFRRPPLQPTS